MFGDVDLWEENEYLKDLVFQLESKIEDLERKIWDLRQDLLDAKDAKVYDSEFLP